MKEKMENMRKYEKGKKEEKKIVDKQRECLDTHIKQM